MRVRSAGLSKRISTPGSTGRGFFVTPSTSPALTTTCSTSRRDLTPRPPAPQPGPPSARPPARRSVRPASRRRHVDRPQPCSASPQPAGKAAVSGRPMPRSHRNQPPSVRVRRRSVPAVPPAPEIRLRPVSYQGARSDRAGRLKSVVKRQRRRSRRRVGRPTRARWTDDRTACVAPGLR